MLAAVTVISFGINLWEMGRDPLTAFYSPQARLWELSVGAVLAYGELFRGRAWQWVDRVDANLRSWIGAVLVGGSVALFSKTTPFPGWWALPPVLGAVLMISAGPDAWLNRRVLAARPLVAIGLISFPLYLWHWPLLYFASIYSEDTPPLSLRLAAVALSFLFAAVTYHLVEKPIRRGRRGNLVAGVAFASMAVIGVSSVFASVSLLPSTLSPAQQDLVATLAKAMAPRHDLTSIYGPTPCFRFEWEKPANMFIENKCFDIRYPGHPTLMLIGDSHSASLSLGLRPLLDRNAVNLIQVSTGWCNALIDDKTAPVCETINKMVLDNVKSIMPDVLIISYYWLSVSRQPSFEGNGDFLPALLAKLNELKRLGAKKIILVGEIPIWKTALPVFLARHYVRRNLPVPDRTFDDIDQDSLATDTAMHGVKYPDGVTYVSLKDLLCNQAGCLTSVGPDLGQDIIVWDDEHLTIAGAEFVTRQVIEPVIDNELGIR